MYKPRSINEGVERAHRDGVLTAASLMVGAAHAPDAIERAHRLPGLAVGLHLVVSRGRATLPPGDSPDLTDEAGEMPCGLVSAGVRYAFVPAVRRQLAAEIRAQFEAFRVTGLALDHVNAHNHMHLHPTVLALVLEIGRDYGLRWMRLPSEPPPRDIARRLRALPWRAGLAPWLALLRQRMRAAGVACNDHFYGLHASGAMTTEEVVGILDALPPGITEIGFHPATEPNPGGDPFAQGFRFDAELAALTSAEVAGAVERSGARRCAFRDLDAGRS